MDEFWIYDALMYVRINVLFYFPVSEYLRLIYHPEILINMLAVHILYIFCLCNTM